MAAEWLKVDDEVLDLAADIITEYIPELQDASIAFLFRSEAQRSGDRITMGQAKKVSAEYQALGLDNDFLIWLAQDIWYSLTEHQKRALVHHELLHCGFSNDKDPKPKLKPHDFEEFDAIIAIYGFWRPNGGRTVEAVQAALPMMELKRAPHLEALDPAVMHRN